MSLANDKTLLDALNEAVYAIFQAPVDGDITHVSFQTTAKVVGSNDWVITVGIQGVDATTGYPDGTYLNSGNAKVTINAADLAANTTYTVALAASATVSRTNGTRYALVIAMTTYPGTGSIEITNSTPFGSLQRWVATPYLVTYVGGTTAKNTSQLPIMAVKIGGVFYNCMCDIPRKPAGVYTKTTSTPDEIGNSFVMPWSCNADGVWCWIQQLTDNVDLVLYDGSDTVLQTISIDKDVVAAGTAGGLFTFPSRQTLTKDATYRLSFKATTTTQWTGLTKLTYDNADMVGMLPGGNTYIYGTQRTDAGSWIDLNSAGNTYARFPIGLILDGIDIPAGGTGGGPLVGLGGLIS